MSTFGPFLKSLISDIGPFGAFKFWKNVFNGNLFNGSWYPYKDTFDTAAGSSLINKATGAGLTGAESEANAFNAAEAQKNRDWQERMSNTQYQRQVADMKAAGVNPALAMSGGNGAGVPSGATASAGSSQNGMSLSDILQLMQFKTQTKALQAGIEKTKAETDQVKADTSKTEAETRESSLNAEFLAATMEARKRSLDLQNDNSEATTRKTYKDIDVAEQNIKKAIAETRESETRAALNEANEILSRASAQQIRALLPYQQLLMSAQTERERAAAGLAIAQAAYQNKLIDSRYIDQMVRQMTANAATAEAEAYIAKSKEMLRQGTFFKDIDTGNKVVDWMLNTDKKVASSMLQGLCLLVDNFPKVF